MFDRLGLGVELDLRDNMSRRIDPVIRDLDRLKRSAQNTASSIGQSTNAMDASFRRGFNRRYMQDFNASMQGTGAVLNNVSDRLVKATNSALAFQTATNSSQAIGNFNRMHNELMRTQRTLGMMGFGMSEMQKRMGDSRAFNVLNYQMKDLNDRIKLTRQALVEMQNSPDSSKFTQEMSVARRALEAYENQLKQVNMQQQLANTHGMQLHNLGGRDTLVRPADTLGQSLAYRALGLSMLDVAHASNIAYNSIDKTGKMMLGLGYTAMEARQKLTMLAGTLTMTGMALSMFLTVPLSLATIGIGLLVSRWEDAVNTMHARTLMPEKMFTDSARALRDISVDTGATQQKVGASMSIAQNTHGNKGFDYVKDQTSRAVFTEQVHAISSEKSIADTNKIMKQFGVTSEQAWDMYIAGAMEVKKETGKGFTGMKGIDRIMDSIEAAPDKYKKLTGAMGEYSDSYNRMVKNMEKGFTESFSEMIGTAGTLLITIFGPALLYLVPVFDKIKGGLQKIIDFLRANEDAGGNIARNIGLIGLAVAGLLIIAGPLMLLTGLFLTYRNVIQGVASAIFGFSKGGLAVLSPQALLARDNMKALTVAFARLPNTILFGVIPALYTFIRMIPNFILNIIRINPVFAGLSLGMLAYGKNWFGLKDTINSAIGGIKTIWKGLEDSYKNSNMPMFFRMLKLYAKSFFEGFVEGVGLAIETGFKFLKMILEPIQKFFKAANPYVTDFLNVVSKLFGGEGNFTEGAETWKAIGKAVGIVTVAFLALKGVLKVTSFLTSPFVKMNAGIVTVENSIRRLIAKMGLLKAAGVGAVSGAVAGARNTVMGTNGNNPVVGTPSLLQRGKNFLTSPFRAVGGLTSAGLASLGVGSGLAMGRQMQGSRQQGNLLRANPMLLNSMRTSGMAQRGLTANGAYQGSQVHLAKQGLLSRALFGQRSYTYDPQKNAAGQTTGYSRNNFATTGGILRGANRTMFGVGRSAPNMIQNSPNMLQRGASATRAGISSRLRALGAGALGMAGGLGSSLLRTPLGVQASGVGSRLGGFARGASSFVGRGYDRFTGSRLAQGAGRLGGHITRQLGSAGIVNPYAGATVGGSRLGQAANFARVGAMGTASMIGSGAMMAGRGVGAVGRGVGTVARGAGRVAQGAGRMATAPLRGIGRAAGGLAALAMNPVTLLAGLAGYGAFKAFGGQKKDKDGNITKKGSVHNIAGNMDKASENMLKGGDGKIVEFWNKFWKTATPILKSTGKLLLSAFTALGKATPAILKSIGAGLLLLGKFIKEGALKGWEWAKTDGVILMGQAASKIGELLGQAWEWIKTTGMDKLGQFFTWLLGKAGEAGTWVFEKLGMAWEWVKTKGIDLLGQFFSWLVGTALPNAVSMIFTGFGLLWNWIWTDGVAILGKIFIWLWTVAVPEAIGLVFTLFSKLWGWVIDDGMILLGKLWSWITDTAIPGVASGILTALTGAFSAIYDVAVGIWNKIVGIFGGDPTNGGAKESYKAPAPSVTYSKATSKKPSPMSNPYQIKSIGAYPYADGGLITNPHLGLVGEAGPEMIIPLSGGKRSRGLELFNKTANLLGLKAMKPPKDNFNGKTPSGNLESSGNSTPIRNKRVENSQPSSQDNSLTIQHMEVVFPESMSGIGEVSAKNQANFILKELKAKLKMERLRSGNRKMSLEDLILGDS